MIEETREDRLVGENIEIDKAMSPDGWQYVSHRVETVQHEHTTPGSVSYTGRVDSDGDIHLTEHVTPDHTSYWSETVYYVTYRRVFHDPSHAQDVRRWEATLTDKKADYREKEYCRNLIAASFGFEMPVAVFGLFELPALPNVKDTGATNLLLGFFALFLSAGVILILIWGIRKAVRASKIKELKTKIEYLTR